MTTILIMFQVKRHWARGGWSNLKVNQLPSAAAPPQLLTLCLPIPAVDEPTQLPNLPLGDIEDKDDDDQHRNPWDHPVTYAYDAAAERAKERAAENVVTAGTPPPAPNGVAQGPNGIR